MTSPDTNAAQVSVLLPFHNAAATLVEAVESIRSQTFTGWELLLLDDGSTDGSGALAAEHARRDPRIRLRTFAHRGIVPTLNDGLAEARGKYVARMDADDVCHPERLWKQAALLETHPEVGVVGCRVAYGGDTVAQAGYAAHVDWLNGLLSAEAHFANRFVDATVAHPSVLFRREICEEHGGYRDGDFPEDFELWLRWMEAGVRFAKVPETLLTWRDPPSRLSRTDPRYAPEAFYRVKCDYLLKCVPRQRPIWLWGSGRLTRQRFAPLEPFAGYVDVDPGKTGQNMKGRPVIFPQELPPEAFVLCGVASRGARKKIETFLEESGRRVLRDYLLCA